MHKVFIFILLLAFCFSGCWENSPKKAEESKEQKNVGQPGQDFPQKPEFVALDKEKENQVELNNRLSQNPSQYEAKVDKTKEGIQGAIEKHCQQNPSFRGYIQTDKPLYQPGETIWIKTTDVPDKTFVASRQNESAQYMLISPRGTTVAEKCIRSGQGASNCDIDLSEDIAGGEYTIQVLHDGRKVAERKVIVNTYQPPRIKKKLEFLRKAYGPGDSVQASLQVQRATGELLANFSFVAVVSIEGNEIKRFSARTDSKGEAMVQFTLPDKIEKEDGMLNILLEEGGVTESIARPIPIVLQKINLAIYPEGGNLIVNLPSRVYFYATNMIDKPADMDGLLVSSKGEVLERFSSYHRGMGYFTITPQADEEYFIKVTKPIGIKSIFKLPKPMSDGIVIKTGSEEGSSLRLAVYSKSNDQNVFVCAMLRENILGILPAKLRQGANEILLPLKQNLQGVARITVFDKNLLPMAERLVYLGRGQDIVVKVTPRQQKYYPRNKVELDIEATTLEGKPAKANLCLSVVDDTVLSFADDKTAHILASLYLQSEIPTPVEEPNFYFSKEEKAPQALDMLLATLGWRTFGWSEVFAPSPVEKEEFTKDEKLRHVIVEEMQMVEEKEVQKPMLREKPMPAKAEPEANAKPASPPLPPLLEKVAKGKAQDMNKIAMERDLKEVRGMEPPREMEPPVLDREDGEEQMPLEYSRKFPVPVYEPGYDGPRNDFRETIFWEPDVQTDQNGKATVTFYLSDAITTFRAICEGISDAGIVGRTESVIQSKLPFYMTVKTPAQVSAQDVIYLPLTLTNEQDSPLSLNLATKFSPLFKLLEDVAPGTVNIKGGERMSFFFPLEIVGKSGKGEIYFKAQALGLKDEFTSTIAVSPRGFPKQFSFSGTLTENAVEYTASIPDQVIEGSLNSKITLYPSPLSTMIAGMEDMLNEPCGCFEQASSSNYPNLMVLQYFKEYNVANVEMLQRVNGLLDRGYKRIAGYESSQKGYEWFGGNPAHEALTAYGLMEFKDMESVYEKLDVPMVKRTAEWLSSRRDGKGGYLRNPVALDSFGAASPEITNSYITYALTEAGYTDIKVELKTLQELGEKSDDPYLVALAVNALFNIPGNEEAAKNMASKLAKMQKQDGSFQGTTHSITRSTGINLDVETTSLVAIALMKGDGYVGEIAKSMEWLSKNRRGTGGFGATQASILSIKALALYAKKYKSADAPGDVILTVSGKQVSQLHFDKGETKPLEILDLAGHLKVGENKIKIQLKSTIKLPYSMLLSYNAITPANDPECALSIETSIARPKTKMGETVRLTAKVKNTTGNGLPMTLARIGIPGGLTFQTWQLKQLQDKKVFSFYETNPREIICYFRDMAPKAEVEIPIDLVASVPGEYAGPASSTYLYYTNDKKNWAQPIKISIGK